MTVIEDRHELLDQSTWTRACALGSMLESRGAAVLLPDGSQAALFRLPGGRLAAIGNIDPFSAAAVMSRGIVGDRRGEPTVASPLLKQVFSLIDGRCLDDERYALPVYEVRVVDGFIEIEVTEPLVGLTVGVTAARRAEEFVALLERRGANVVRAPAIRIVPLVDDVELRSVTAQLVETPPDIVVVTTGIGFRGWVEAAHGWDVAGDLIAALGATRILARGPKARGAVRQAGLCEEWSPESESSAEVLQRLLDEGVDSLRIAVQLHGAASEWEPDTDISEALAKAGAQLIKVPVYRWEPPADPRAMDAMIAMIVNGELDAVSFTSAPAVASLFERAKALGVLDPLAEALRSAVGVYAVGPVTAAPLQRLDISARYPARYRLGALARLITDDLPLRAAEFTAGGHRVAVRSSTVLVDGTIRVLPPAAMALLRRLMIDPGRVVTRADLLAELPGGGGDTHAVETAMARLRSAMAAPGVVQTVVKRGYRLALEEETV